MKPNFICSLHRMLGWKYIQMFQGTWPRWRLGPYMVKTFRNHILRNQEADELGIQHRVLKYNQICSNDDTGLTMTIFMTWSYLFPNASAWVKAYTTYSNIFPTCSNSAYPSRKQLHAKVTQFFTQNLVKWGKPRVGIDKHNISLFLNISIDWWKVSYFYAYLTSFYTKLIIKLYMKVKKENVGRNDWDTSQLYKHRGISK